jgi:molybdenum cofactor guanylyltransferase
MSEIDAGAAILVGGESSRFGTDKCQIAWQGTVLPVYLYDLLEPLFSEVFFIANRKDRLDGFTEKTYTDIYPGHGPLGGIHTALQNCKLPYTLIIAGDLPFVNRDLFRLLWKHVGSAEALVPAWETKLEPLCAFYHQRCRSIVEEEIRQQRLGVHSLLKKLDTRYLDLTRFFSAGLISRMFFNINQPEDYRTALNMIELDLI